MVAGGPGALARPETLPKEFKFMRERLEMFREHFSSLKRVVLINHEDCAYYRSLSDRALGVLQTFHIHLPKDDMKLVAQVFARLLSHLGLEVEMYYASFTDADQKYVRFEKVA